MIYLTRFHADSDDPGVTSGTATFATGNTVLCVHLENFSDARNLDDLIGRAVANAKQAQAVYLKGAIAHVIEDAS